MRGSDAGPANNHQEAEAVAAQIQEQHFEVAGLQIQLNCGTNAERVRRPCPRLLPTEKAQLAQSLTAGAEGSLRVVRAQGQARGMSDDENING